MAVRRAQPRARPAAVRWLLAAIALSALLVLPFHLSFDPAARGIGWVGEGRGFAGWVRDQLLLFGSLAVFVALAFLGRLAVTRRPVPQRGLDRRRRRVRRLAPRRGGLRAHRAARRRCSSSPLAAVMSPTVPPGCGAVWVLSAAGVACLLGPEVLYVRDEFDGGPLFRMNTVFKLDYQAWLLLGLAGIGALAWWRTWLPRRAARLLVGAVAAVALAGALVYPIAGTYARKGGFDRSPTLDGLGWLRDRAPGDVAAIDWLNDNAPGRAVVLESVGEDYSAFGHARISTFTGLPTVLGWPGHELQWGHDAGSRQEDVATLYETTDEETARELLDRYGIRYVVVGPLERTDHGDAGVAKWDRLGERVFEPATRPCGRSAELRALAQVEPLGHPARRVPRLALREPVPPGRRATSRRSRGPTRRGTGTRAPRSRELAGDPVAAALGGDRRRRPRRAAPRA